MLKSLESYFYELPKDYEKIYGNVKSISESNYVIKSQLNKLTKDSLTDSTSFSYGQEGNEDSITAFYNSGRLHWKAINYYDDVGKLRQIQYFNSDAVLRTKFLYYYDNNGHLIMCKDFFGQDFEKQTKTIYKYNDLGYLAEITHYDIHDSFDNASKYKFDPKGNISEFTCYGETSGFRFKYRYKYDDCNNEIECKSYSENDSLRDVSSYKYGNYDKAGNWLTRITLENGQPYSIKRRQIEYY